LQPFHFSSHYKLLQVYEYTLSLISQVAWLGHDISRRYDGLLGLGTILSAVAATAIAAGQLVLATEWLESSRSIFWGQLLQLRTPLRDLRKITRNSQRLLVAHLATSKAQGMAPPSNPPAALSPVFPVFSSQYQGALPWLLISESPSWKSTTRHLQKFACSQDSSAFYFPRHSRSSHLIQQSAPPSSLMCIRRAATL
jgi:hypothetical protein